MHDVAIKQETRSDNWHHPLPCCRENVGFPGSPLRLFWRGKQGRMELS